MLTIKQELQLIKTNYDKTIEIVSGNAGASFVIGQRVSAPLLFSQKGQINTIEYYSNSKYLNGQRDELGREKPFFQILNGICDVENAAKDLNTRDITVTSDDGNHYLESFLLSKDIQVWMKEADFAKTLNDIRDIHTRYGSLLVKKVMETEEDGTKTLNIEMPEWKNIITDQVNIIDGAIIEVHWMTANQIAKKKNVWKNVNKVVKKMRDGGSTKRIPIYEIRGEFSQATYLEAMGKPYTDKDETNFSYQLYYIAGEPTESGRNSFLDACYVMYCENDTEKVYKYLARKPKAGRAFGVGVFEEGEEAQVWTNDAVLKQFRAMEYTTKVIGQTSSKKLKGRNLLTETDDGTILEHEEGKPIESLQLLPAGGLGQYESLLAQWFNQLEKTTSAFSMQRGEVTTKNFRLQSMALGQSSSVFRNLQQELGIFITEIFEDWIMPYLAKQLSVEHILAYEFSPDELKEIDRNFSIQNANDKAIELILQGKIVSSETYDGFLKSYDAMIKQTKGQRFIQIPKNFYKNLKAKVTVNITGEQKNKAQTLEALQNVLGMVNDNPILKNIILMKIVELSGAEISPVMISSAINEQNQNQKINAKVSESMNYKDAPEDIKRQIEQQAGLQPSQAPLNPQVSATVQGNKNVKPKQLSLTASSR